MDSVGEVPLHIAAQIGHLLMVEMLDRLGADVNKADDNGQSPMYLAAQGGHASTVEALASLGAA